MKTLSRERLGTMLVHAGKIDNDQLEKSLQIQKKEEGYLGQVFLTNGYIDEKELYKYLSHQLKIPYLQLGYFKNDKSLMDLFTESQIRSNKIFPLFKIQRTLNIAVSDPLDSKTINIVRDITGFRIEPIIASATEIENSIDLHFGISSFIGSDSDISEATNIEDYFDETKVVELVDSIIAQSQKYNCSDIHIEAREKDIRVRFRIDGRLQDFQKLPSDIHTALVSRLKIMANMDIAETRRPQDGRILFNSQQGRLDLRISTYPTLYGEKTVLRLLNISDALHSFGGLGFEPKCEDRFNSMLIGGEGIILVSGPTGSGKTTTLYSTLNKLESPDVNIVTVEDPVEYDLDNINQAQINLKSGVTFASALRSILRQDPDIIMVGEVRDEETVELGIRAALTGHLVFSTIHTNDAASGFTRLLNWNVEPFLIASTVKGILAQRLVRRICKDCKEVYTPSSEELEMIGLDNETDMQFFKGKGCLSCRDTGFKGRIGIYELLLMDAKISELVLNQEPGYKIRKQARKNGMTTLLEDGLIKINRGDTTISEVYETLGTSKIVL